MHVTVDLDADPGPVITLSGDIDLMAADAMEQGGADAVAAAAPDGRVIVDMAGVTFLDSTGIGALVTIANTGADKGVRVVLRSVPERITKLLTITGLDDVFPIEP